jgi:hypothetical protein
VKWNALAMPDSVSLEMAIGFALFMRKALTRGRAVEFIDRAWRNLGTDGKGRWMLRHRV